MKTRKRTKSRGAGSLMEGLEGRVLLASAGDPGALISGDRGVRPGTAYELSLSAVNVAQVLSWTIDWGDEQVQVIDGNAPAVQHIYAQAGRYVISAAALTDEGEVRAGAVRLGRPAAVAQLDGFGDAVLQMRTVGELLYFTTGAPAGPQWLWRTDGSEAGTVRLAQVRPAASTGPQFEMVQWGGTLFFCGYDADHGYELWSSDGTPGGTALVADISDGPASSSPTWLTVLGDLLVFAARQPGTGRELWSSDGTAEGTLLVKDMYPGAQGGGQFTSLAPINPLPMPGSSNPSDFAVMSGVLYFAAADELGTPLWRSDGTGEGTLIVKEYAADAVVGGPTDLLAAEERLYFAINSFDAGNELWRSDGTEAGTVRVAAFGYSPFADGLSQFTAYGQDLYFVAYDSVAGQELWRSDGSEGGTQMVADLWVGAGGSAPSQLVSLGSRLAFVAGDALRGRELWTTAGTADQPFVTPEALGGMASSVGVSLGALAGAAYFASSQDAVITLWRSEGDALDVAVDGSPPVAEVLVRRIKDPQNVRHPIHVIYTDDMELSAETLSGGEVLVRGPRGFTATSRLVGLSASPDGRTWTGRYILRAPAETWGSQDNGIYTVTLSAGTAADLAGNFVAGGVLGRFSGRFAIPRSYGDGTFSAADHDIAYDDAGNLHVVYRDPADGALKYAVRMATGQWSVSAVVDGVSGNTGLRPSLAIDNLRRPAVAYYDGGARAVKFALQDGFAWNVQTVAGRLRGVRHVAMAFDIQGRPAIAFDGGDQGLLFAQRRGGQWVAVQVDPDAGAGTRPDLIATGDGDKWAVAYSAPDAEELRYAVQTRRSWSVSVVDRELGAGGAVSLAVDSLGRPAISYHDAARRDLKLAAFDGSSWHVATVAAPGLQGIVSSLLFVADQPTIVYLDAGIALLRLAEQVEGQWRWRVLRSGAGAWLSASAGPSGASFGWLQSASMRVLVENL